MIENIKLFVEILRIQKQSMQNLHSEGSAQFVSDTHTPLNKGIILHFLNTEIRNNFCQLYFMLCYGYNWTYVFQVKIKLVHVDKSIFLASKTMFTSVTLSSLTETIIIAMLFPFCCQISSKFKHLCFPLTTNFKEI